MKARHLLVFLVIFACVITSAADNPNVLLIAIDDLKPTISNYGDMLAHTPNFERLAGRGMTFTNAHCQQSICAPSRASVLTGLRPDQTRVWDLQTKIRDKTPDIVTLPQFFKEKGYDTAGIGKVFDYRSVENEAVDDPVSWSQPYAHAANNPDEALGFLNADVVARYRAADQAELAKANWLEKRKIIGGIPPYEGDQDVPDEAYEDGRITAKAIELLNELSSAQRPFFLAVGFHKPHLPFVAPKRYWDLYDPSMFKLAALSYLPLGAPDYAYQPGWEIKTCYYTGIPPLSSKENINDETARKLIHGYYACTSYIDAQIGKLIDALEATGKADNTIIALWSDHGWHLGDHGIWCKATNYEQATRSVLMISDPRQPEVHRGLQYRHPVELLDIYQTLCDLCGYAAPPGTEGDSLKPALSDLQTVIKPYAVSQFPRKYRGKPVMGYAWRSDRYRYIEWINRDYLNGDMTGAVVDIELYDYKNDPGETRNLAYDEDYQNILKQMRAFALDYKQAHGLHTHIPSGQ